MAALTRDDLQRVGLDLTPDAFSELVVEAVRAMPATERAGVPAHDLTEEEVAVLERGGFDLTEDMPASSTDDPLARAVAEYAALLATALSPSQVAAQLGIDASRVRHRLAAHALYGMKTAEGWRLPRFQFDPSTGCTIPGADVVFAALDPDLHPVSVQRWFVSPDPDLVVDGKPASPRDWLRRGGDPRAMAPLLNVV